MRPKVSAQNLGMHSQKSLYNWDYVFSLEGVKSMLHLFGLVWAVIGFAMMMMLLGLSTGGEVSSQVVLFYIAFSGTSAVGTVVSLWFLSHPRRWVRISWFLILPLGILLSAL